MASGSQPARGHGERGALLAGELSRQPDGDPLDRCLDQVVVEAHPVPVVPVVLEGSVSHLDDQAALVPEHEREGDGGGDQVRVNAHAQHPQSARQVVLPQLLVPLHVGIPAEYVIDQDVQAALLIADPRYQRRNGAGIEMIDPDGLSATARGRHQVAGLLNGLRPVDLDLPPDRLLRPVPYTCTPRLVPAPRRWPGRIRGWPRLPARPVRKDPLSRPLANQHPLTFRQPRPLSAGACGAALAAGGASRRALLRLASGFASSMNRRSGRRGSPNRSSP